MSIETQALALFEEANPVPDVDKLTVVDSEAAAYLATLEQRSSEMTQVDTAKKSETPKRPLGPWLIAAAAAAILGVAIVLVTSNSETAPVATIPTPTTIVDAAPTTVVDAAPTTISEQTETPTTQPATPTTTLPKILSGTYSVPDEVPPGTYRFWFRAVRLDENMETIAAHLIGGAENSAYGIVIVQPTDSFIRVEDWIITVEDFGKPLDPIANRYNHGTYLVGYDLEPGRYEVHPDGNQPPYWARLDDEMEIIDSGTGVEILEFTVEEGDFALEYNGPLRLIP